MALHPELAKSIVEFRQAQTALLEYYRINGSIRQSADLYRLTHRMEAKIAALAELVSSLFGDEAEHQQAQPQEDPQSKR